MRQKDGIFIIESPMDNLNDIFHSASVDSGDFHAKIFPDSGQWGFVISKNEIGADPFALSDFHFNTEAEALSWLEPQLPYVNFK